MQINKYQDIEAAKQEQAIQKGWIPSILPESAYEIARHMTWITIRFLEAGGT